MFGGLTGEKINLTSVSKTLKYKKLILPLQLQWISNLKTTKLLTRVLYYSSPYSNFAYISGKIPNKLIKTSGANPNPPQTLGEEIKAWLKENNISLGGNILSNNYLINQRITYKKLSKREFIIHL